MAYFYSSNYQQGFDNYHQDLDDYIYNHQSYNYVSHEPRYVQNNYDHTSYYGNAYEFSVTPSLVGYHYNQSEFLAPKNLNSNDKSSDYYDDVTTQFVISYSTNEGAENDLEFEEYNPEPYGGGYDISETYGKALPPSDEICYPPSKIDPSVPSHLDDPSILKSAPPPYGEADRVLESEVKPKTGNGIVPSNVIQEENALDFEEDEEEEEEDEEEEDDDGEGKGEGEGEENRESLQNREDEVKPTNGNIVSQVIQERNASESEDEEEEEGSDNSKEIRRQIPPGYGLEAMDLCEGLFGGYFPCLSKRNKGTYHEQNGSSVRMNEYGSDYVQETVDYLFGNPNPYGGSMPERGSYGDPIYSYQRHHPQQSISGLLQNYEENSSWLHNAMYYNAHNAGYQQQYNHFFT